MKTLHNWSEIPELDSLEDEATFWQSHSISPDLLANSKLESDGKESTTITLRFDPRMLGRIKRMARSRYLNYQSMIKQWLSERLEEEVHKHDDTLQLWLQAQIADNATDATTKKWLKERLDDELRALEAKKHQ